MSLTKLGPYDVGPNRIDLAEWINTPSGDKFLASFSGTSGSILVSAQAEGILEGTFTFNGRQSDNSAIKTITNGKFKVNLLQVYSSKKLNLF